VSWIEPDLLQSRAGYRALKHKYFEFSGPRLFLYTILIGFVGAFAAQIFVELLKLATHFFMGVIAQYQAPGLPREGGPAEQVIGSHGLWFIPLVTTLGGLISGFLVYTFAPEAEGHGTDAAVDAYHQRGGRIRAIVPLIKTLASAVTIGSGGAAGREGPTAQISAGVGSILATWLKLDDRTRRLLVLTGIAAGLSAIFRSPLGTAIFAVEILYYEMEFEARMLIYTIIAAVTAYAVNGLFVGWDPIFTLPGNLRFEHPTELIWYAVLGIFTGVVGAALPSIFYYAKEFFDGLKIPRMLKPALGGLLLGILAMFLPQLLGGGYGWMQMAIDGKLGMGLLLLLALGKIVALSLTISSGGSGGVFAPSLYSGAMLGAFIATAANQIVPGEHLNVAAFSVVGMAAFFAGAARVPIATLLMVSEMTGGYGLTVPLMLAVGLSYTIHTYLTRNVKYPSLYVAQVRNRAASPVHHEEFLRTALSILKHGRAKMTEAMSPFDLRDLVQAGIPVPLESGGGRSMLLGVVRPNSSFAGQALREIFTGHDHLLVVSIIRNGKFSIPDGNTVLQPWDRIIIIMNPKDYEKYRQDIKIAYLESLRRRHRHRQDADHSESATESS